MQQRTTLGTAYEMQDFPGVSPLWTNVQGNCCALFEIRLQQEVTEHVSKLIQSIIVLVRLLSQSVDNESVEAEPRGKLGANF